MATTVRCPKCFAHVPPGRLCDRCGAPLPHDVDPTPDPLEASLAEALRRSGSGLRPDGVDRAGTAVRETAPAVSRPDPPQPSVEPIRPADGLSRADPVGGGQAPSVAVDGLCLQNESWGDGFLRVRFYPGEGMDGCDNVTLTLQDQATKRLYALMDGAWCNRPREFRVIVDRHALGPVGYFISLAYEKDGRRVRMEGDWATVSIADKDARDAARQLVVNITNNITTGHACDVNNSSLVKDRLEEMLKSGGDVSKQLRDLVCGPDRAYAYLDLFDESGILPLPSPQPPAARTDRLVLDLGGRRLLLFSGRTVTFGRRRDWCDISWRHPNADCIPANDPAHNDYLKISKRQCSFEHRGEKVALIDGVRDNRGVVTPSSYGTYLNAVRVDGEKILSTDGTGSGLLTFSDSAATGTLSVCLPGGVCTKCPRAERTWCQGGRRPSLVFKRLDGVPETAVMVWSCFRLEEVDPSFEGVKIFRENGGFAWRRGRRCGWLVPGEAIETDCGTVRVSHLPSPAELEKEKNVVRNDSETCHS